MLILQKENKLLSSIHLPNIFQKKCRFALHRAAPDSLQKVHHPLGAASEENARVEHGVVFADDHLNLHPIGGGTFLGRLKKKKHPTEVFKGGFTFVCFVLFRFEKRNGSPVVSRK